MLICKSGRTIEKKRKGVTKFFIRLNLIDTDEHGAQKYRTKDIDTGLTATKRNRIKANAMLEDKISRFSPIGESTQFAAYCQYWLDKKKSEIEIITFEGYQYRVKHIIEYFSDHPVTLGKLTADHIDQFYHYLLTKEKVCTSQHDENGLSNRSIKDIATILRSILSDTLMLGHVKNRENILRITQLKIPKKPESVSKDAYIGIDDIDDFKAAIKGHRLETAYTLAFYYGLRREEIAGLRWSAIRNGRMYIEHTVTKLKTTVAKDRTKTYTSHRDYPIPPEIMKMLEEIYAAQMLNRELMGDSYHNSDYIFTWEDGRPYSPDYLTKSFKKLVKASDKLDDRLTLHSLRSSCVSVMVHEGIDIKDIQAWVGHSDISTTMNIYAKTNQKQQQKVNE